jgi:hypothetical protein
LKFDTSYAKLNLAKGGGVGMMYLILKFKQPTRMIGLPFIIKFKKDEPGRGAAAVGDNFPNIKKRYTYRNLN